VEINHSNAPHGAEEPLGTVTTQHNRFNLVTPVLAGIGGPAYSGKPRPVDQPINVVQAESHTAVIAPTLIQTGYGERPGQAARVPGLHKPLGTMVDGQKHALVSAFVARHFGGMVGREMDRPVDTVTARDHHALAAVAFAKFNGNEENGHPGAGSVETPLPTITAGGNHIAEVRAFLTAFYGQDGSPGKGQRADESMRTLTTKHRLGLVTIEGTDYQIVDIGMRMLQPHELLRAQFGRFAAAYDLSAAKTKAGQVRLIGNSVAPEVAEALILANLPGEAEARGVA
jgi:DNA (cytosine-5)-methyltransferase 1